VFTGRGKSWGTGVFTGRGKSWGTGARAGRNEAQGTVAHAGREEAQGTGGWWSYPNATCRLVQVMGTKWNTMLPAPNEEVH